jgi:hypothetical protein
MKLYEYTVCRKYAFVVAGENREDVEAAVENMDEKYFDCNYIDEVGFDRPESDDPIDVRDVPDVIDLNDVAHFVVKDRKLVLAV